MGTEETEGKTATPQGEVAGVPLVVDLDGTLCRTDTLHEALLALVSSEPLKLLQLPGWLRAGRAEFKAKIADIGVIDPAELPLNEEVVELIRQARAENRPTALVSAADHRQVAAVAQATGLFDEFHGSKEGKNLKGAEKAAFLTERFGANGFDYIGDSRSDLPVWKAARRAITVGLGNKLQGEVQVTNAVNQHLDLPDSRARAMVRALRPHQWLKNILLFLPMLAAHDLSKLGITVMGFITFSLVASAVYILNDLVDLAADRAHPRKCKRPFASGALSASTGIQMAGGLMLVACVLALAMGSPFFLMVLFAYLMATFAYSFWLKRKLLVDVLTLAGLYTLRVIAGGAVAAVPLSPWLLGLSVFLFLTLAAIKRQAELTDQLSRGKGGAGRAYQVDDLPVLRGIALSAGQATVLVLALYINSDDVQTLYRNPDVIWLICPLLLYWLLRMVMKTHRGAMTDDPIVFATTDRTSQLLILACAVLAIVAV